MDSCEGVLLIPPERGQLLGRALWKPRYVIVGRRNAHKHDKIQNHAGPSVAHVANTSRVNSGSTSKPSHPTSIDDYVISIFKSKDDWDPTHQYPVSSVVECQVQTVAHRKQGPVLPTLIVTLSDKERKRRSSRAAGLITNKESTTSTLWFRTPPDDHHISLYDWARYILSRKLPLSPDSPASPSFSNPFAQRGPQNSDYHQRPPSGNNPSRSAFFHKPSNHGGRERPVTFSSDSPSLRSRRSDISSPSSLANQPQSAYAMPDLNQYTTVLPSDIPSPVTTAGEYRQGELIEGWTSAQGRSSTVSSPARVRGSISSQAQQPGSAGADSNSPHAAHETILDRAFQLRYIPGSEREMPGEDKLSSLARFDALMREEDQRRRQQKQAELTTSQKSAWDLDKSTDSEKDEADGGGDDEEEEDDDDDDDDDDSDNFAHEADENRQTLIPPRAQRALEFLAGRHDPESSLPYPSAHASATGQHQAANFHVPLQAPARPHTAHSKVRPTVNHRTHSQPYIMPRERSDVPVPSAGKTSSEDGPPRPAGEKRVSASSAQRLSFTEFTKRLSSTSSLLLVQTNASGGSSRESIEFDRNPSQAPKAPSNNRPVPPRPRRDLDREDWEKRCGWGGGGVGIGFGEGGFL